MGKRLKKVIFGSAERPERAEITLPKIERNP
jgi:hypothetical protein